MKKVIETADYWGRSGYMDIAEVNIKFPETDWIIQRKQRVDSEYYMHMINAKGFRFNWLLKIWAKLNNL